MTKVLHTPGELPNLVKPAEADPRWTWAWYGWIAAFFVIEGTALARHRQQDTLSDHVWVWFDIPHRSTPVASVRVRRLGLLTFLAWLCSHFLSGDEV